MNVKKLLLPILLATLWIGFSEFLRNQVILNSFWTSHYDNLGLTFPSRPINGALWMLWSLMFAIYIYILAQKFTLRQTTTLAWWSGFLMMWVVLGNLSVLPMKILWAAIPLSVLEAFVASWIIFRFKKN